MTDELPLNRIFDVTVNKQTTFPTQMGFSTVMLMTTETTGPLDADDRVGIYASAAEAEDAGWPTTSHVYKAINAIYSQAVTPTQVKVGWLAIANLVDAVACPVLSVVPSTIDQNLGEIAAGDAPVSQQHLLNGCEAAAIQFTLPASGIASVVVTATAGDEESPITLYIFDENDALEHTSSGAVGSVSYTLADVVAGRRTAVIVAGNDGVVDTGSISLTIT